MFDNIGRLEMIKGIHHVCIKCDTQEKYEETLRFYQEVLKMKVKRQWDGGTMMETGAGLIEIFNQGDAPLEQGVIRHFALATDCVDEVVDAVRKADYPITVDLKNVTIPCDPPYSIRIAFCTGPMEEEIELFQEM